MTKKGSKSVPGTGLRVGDLLMVGWKNHQRIVSATPGQHPMGAKYLDVVLADGEEWRCWAGFNFHIEVDVVMTLQNSTPRELAELP